MTTQFALDHLVIAVRDLKQAIADYSALGFTVTAGGRHTHAPTQNALVYFADGAYFELIEWLAGVPGEKWYERLQAHGDGLVDFALVPKRLADALKQAATGNVSYKGPIPGSRFKADGEEVKWELAWPKSYALPFLCGDITPRVLRVPEGSVAVHKNRAQGVAAVAIRVHDLAGAARDYTRLLGIASGSASLSSQVLQEPGLDICSIRLGPSVLNLVSPLAGSTAPAAVKLRADLVGLGEGAYRLVVDVASAQPAPRVSRERSSGASLVFGAAGLALQDQVDPLA
jgi:catechol 2,3-dioxygenase-like lactoylglutathione lyase family enzyme